MSVILNLIWCVLGGVVSGCTWLLVGMAMAPVGKTVIPT
jgi:uncharacterized membrane protein YccF (DUF307 family)